MKNVPWGCLAKFAAMSLLASNKIYDFRTYAKKCIYSSSVFIEKRAVVNKINLKGKTSWFGENDIVFLRDYEVLYLKSLQKNDNMWEENDESEIKETL